MAKKKEKNMLDNIVDGANGAMSFTGDVVKGMVDDAGKAIDDIGKKFSKGDVVGGTAQTADAGAKLVVPYYEAGTDLAKGDYLSAGINGVIDTAGIVAGAFSGGTGYAGAVAVKGALKGGEAVGKAAVKETVKQGAKAATKEVVEQGAKKATKEVVEQGTKAVVKDSVKSVAKEAAKDTAKTATKQTVEKGAEMGIASSLAKSAIKKVGKDAAKETTEKATKTVAKEAAEKVAKDGAKEAAEQGTKAVAKDKAKDLAKKAGVAALKKPGTTAVVGGSAYYLAKNGGDVGKATGNAVTDVGKTVGGATVSTAGGLLGGAAGGLVTLGGMAVEGVAHGLEKQGLGSPLGNVGQVLDRVGDRVRGVGKSIQDKGLLGADYSAVADDDKSPLGKGSGRSVVAKGEKATVQAETKASAFSPINDKAEAKGFDAKAQQLPFKDNPMAQASKAEANAKQAAERKAQATTLESKKTVEGPSPI